MYETYSRQSLPPREYRELLGSALCVFNSNNSFVIENILSKDEESKYTWLGLIDVTSGDLSEPIKETISSKSNKKIASKFNELISKRNRIVHSFQVTFNEEQILATKKKSGEQFIITEQYLLKFIKENEELSSMLHNFRGY